MIVPNTWQTALSDETAKPYFNDLKTFVDSEYETRQVFPPREDVFSALDATPPEKVRVVILGQDPYHDDGQAHGMAFSVRPGIKPPPSLVNIYKELREDVGCTVPNHGYLVAWAQQGVLLLNTVLTVRAHEANSHKGKGWETFTDAVLRTVNNRSTPIIFVLWGNPAQKKMKLIDANRHSIIKSAHPSPLSAHNGFFGSRPFSQINAAITQGGGSPIDWQLSNIN